MPLTMPDMKPILFLDIDGVLNAWGENSNGLDTDKCDLLETIVKATGCGIVLSSTWRRVPRALGRVRRLCHDIGAELVDVTPLLPNETCGLHPNPTRGDEIEHWLGEHPECTQYVVLDDDEEGLRASTSLQEHLVLTDSYVGLTPAIADAVIQRFASFTHCPNPTP